METMPNSDYSHLDRIEMARPWIHHENPKYKQGQCVMLRNGFIGFITMTICYVDNPEVTEYEVETWKNEERLLDEIESGILDERDPKNMFFTQVPEDEILAIINV